MKYLGKIYFMALSTNSNEGDCNDSPNIIMLLSNLLRQISSYKEMLKHVQYTQTPPNVQIYRAHFKEVVMPGNHNIITRTSCTAFQ